MPHSADLHLLCPHMLVLMGADGYGDQRAHRAKELREAAIGCVNQCLRIIAYSGMRRPPGALSFLSCSWTYSRLHLSAVDYRHNFTAVVIYNLQKGCNLYDTLKSTEEQPICSAKYLF